LYNEDPLQDIRDSLSNVHVNF